MEYLKSVKVAIVAIRARMERAIPMYVMMESAGLMSTAIGSPIGSRRTEKDVRWSDSQ